jgi:hypothetical protein
MMHNEKFPNNNEQIKKARKISMGKRKQEWG